MKQRIALLGSTGSIGKSALEVVRHHSDRLQVATLAAFGSDPELMANQIKEFAPSLVAIFDPESAQSLESQLDSDCRLVVGDEGLLAAATHPDVDLVVAAMVGAAGLPAVFAALDAGKDVALANKESLVVAGSLLTKLAADRGATILPIDSEHVALHQSLRAGDRSEVRRLVLTASGGPFRTRDLATWDSIGIEEALKHPTWQMGAKISIDSATLMNKGLELIEASHLFGFPAERIDVVVHPQSIVHSMVEYLDGSWIAQLSVNEMIFPIQYALAYPDRWGNEFPRLQPHELGSLEFEPLDSEKFPTVDLAKEALVMGESGPAVLNAANEVAVGAFLNGDLPFVEIVPTVRETLRAHKPANLSSLDDALSWDQWGRETATERLLSLDKG